MKALSIVITVCLILSGYANSYAQGLTREWSSPYADENFPAISHDGSRFARQLTDTTVERYIGVSGTVIDTLHTPIVVTPERMAYCGNRLYMLIGKTKDTIPLVYCEPGSITCIETDYRFTLRSTQPSEHVGLESLSLFSIPGNRNLLVGSELSTSYGSQHSNSASNYFIDTSTHKPLALDEKQLTSHSQIRNVSWSANLTPYLINYYYSSGDYGPSPDDYSTSYDNCEYYKGFFTSSTGYGYDENGGTYPPPGFTKAVHAGALNYIGYSNVVVGMKFDETDTVPFSNATVLASLYPPTVVLLGVQEQQQQQTILYMYDFIRKQSAPLDTLVSCVKVWVNGVAGIVYALDTAANQLVRYRLDPFTPKDTVEIIPSTYAPKLFSYFDVFVRSISKDHDYDKYAFLIADSTFTQMKTINSVFAFSKYSGDQKTTMSLIDTEQLYTKSVPGPTLQVYRPEKCVMATLSTLKYCRSLRCSDDGSYLLMSADSSFQIYPVPMSYADNSLKSTYSLATYAFGGYFAGDSLRLAKSEVIGDSTHFSYHHGSTDFIDPTVVDKLVMKNMPFTSGENHTRFYNEALYNRDAKQHFTLMRERQTRGLTQYYPRIDGIWKHSPTGQSKGEWLVLYNRVTDTTQRDLGISGDVGILDADVNYKSTVLVTNSRRLVCYDWTNNQHLFSIPRAEIFNARSAFQIDSTSILSSSGLLTLTWHWEMKNRFSFKDGMKAIRINAKYSFILREDADSVGCIVDNYTGNVVEELGEGFDTPKDAVFDASRNVIHISDDFVIATYDVSKTVNVRENRSRDQQECDLTANIGADGTLQAQLPLGSTSLSIYTSIGECLFTLTVQADSEEVRAALPRTMANGAYILVAHGPHINCAIPFIR